MYHLHVSFFLLIAGACDRLLTREGSALPSPPACLVTSRSKFRLFSTPETLTHRQETKSVTRLLTEQLSSYCCMTEVVIIEAGYPETNSILAWL